MSRIKIACSEKDKEQLLYCLLEGIDCPFIENNRECSKSKDCKGCIESNIEFEIKEAQNGEVQGL